MSDNGHRCCPPYEAALIEGLRHLMGTGGADVGLEDYAEAVALTLSAIPREDLCAFLKSYRIHGAGNQEVHACIRSIPLAELIARHRR